MRIRIAERSSRSASSSSEDEFTFSEPTSLPGCLLYTRYQLSCLPGPLKQEPCDEGQPPPPHPAHEPCPLPGPAKLGALGEAGREQERKQNARRREVGSVQLMRSFSKPGF